MLQLSVILPAFNEGAKIGQDLKACFDFFSREPYQTEILVVSDGSTDDTDSQATKAMKWPAGQVRGKLVSYSLNRGKGFAIRKGVEAARGERILFMDVGLCVPLKCLGLGLEKLREGYDFAVGSRRLNASVVRRKQRAYRRAGSRIFNWMISQTMGIGLVLDAQCGFKLYRREAAKKIFSKVRCDGFMFDVEALREAKRMGFVGAEFPVEWSNDGDTRYDPIFGTLRNLRELLKIRFERRT